jgi:hypothetical protein
MAEKIRREIVIINKALQLKPINKPIRYLIMWCPDDGSGKPGFCQINLTTRVRTPCPQPTESILEELDEMSEEEKQKQNEETLEWYKGELAKMSQNVPRKEPEEGE